jgi:hypothetical protein
VSLLDLFADKKSQMLSELGHKFGASKTVPAEYAGHVLVLI